MCIFLQYAFCFSRLYFPLIAKMKFQLVLLFSQFFLSTGMQKYKKYVRKINRNKVFCEGIIVLKFDVYEMKMLIFDEWKSKARYNG